jgi:hypothetical protein
MSKWIYQNLLAKALHNQTAPEFAGASIWIAPARHSLDAVGFSIDQGREMMTQAVDHATTKIPPIFVPLDDGGALYAVTADRVIPLSELSVSER